jgi:hypothetical protein
MKIKLKIDAKTLQDFGIRHVEKAVFGGAIAFLMLFVYQAFGRSVFPFTPEELTKISENVKLAIKNSDATATRQSPNYPMIATRIRLPIESRPYELKIPWDLPVFPTPKTRPSLDARPITELRAASGHGQVTSTGDRGSRVPGGIYWVVLTGVYDYGGQRKEAEELYRSCLYRTAKDIPEVVGFKVERADVTTPEDEAKLTWVSLDVAAALAKFKLFQGQGRELAPTEFVLAQKLKFTSPLPPVVNHVWGQEVVHLPEIPVFNPNRHRGGHAAIPGEAGVLPQGFGVSEAQAPEAQGAGAAPDGHAKPKGKDDEPLPEGVMVSDSDTAQPGAPGGEIPTAEGYMEAADGRGPMPMPVEGPETEGPMPMPGAAASAGTQQQPLRLFRFFDFDVKPGKTYRYRVKVLITNPNFKILEQYVKTPEDALKKYLESEWSQPASNAVSLPLDAYVLAGPVFPAKSFSTEPKGKLAIVSFNARTGVENFTEFNGRNEELLRGQMLNFRQRTLSGQSESRAGAGRPLPGGATAAEADKGDFITNNLLLDFRGGNSLTGKLKTDAGSVLLLDSSGRLAVRNELEDEKDIAQRRVSTDSNRRTPSPYSPYGAYGTEEPGMYGEMPMPGAVPKKTGAGPKQKPKRKTGDGANAESMF